MDETEDTCEHFWSEYGNYVKINFLLWLITKVISSPHSHRLADELRAEESFRDLLREHVSLRGFFPDVCVYRLGGRLLLGWTRDQ